MDLKSWLMPEESPYAINHSNPILYKDEKGDFGVVGGVFGLGSCVCVLPQPTIYFGYIN